MSVYAVIQTGGKQYRVAPGDVIEVEKLEAEPGTEVRIDRVYLLSADGQLRTGTPFLTDARVTAQVLDQGRGEKIIVFKKRRRKGYYKTQGHRQYLTTLRITEIVIAGASYKAEAIKKPQPKARPVSVKAREEQPKKATKAPVSVPEEPAKQPEPVKQPPPPVARREKAAPTATVPAQPSISQPAAAVVTKQTAETSISPPLAAASQKPADAATVRREPAPVEAAPAITFQKPEEITPKPAALEARKEQPPSAPQQPKPAIREPSITGPERSATSMPPRVETRPVTAERINEPVSQAPKRWGLYAAVAGILALLVLLLFLLIGGPGPQTGQQAETPTGETAPAAVSGGERPRKKPPVSDKKIPETAPVRKPVAPVQPPD